MKLPTELVKKTGNPNLKKELTEMGLLSWSIAVSLLFFILLLIGIWHHQPWRDEFQALQIAISSHSLPELFYNIRYEGHPATWHLLLYVLTRFTHNYFYMQLLHIVLATLTAFLVLRYAPFAFWMRVLLIFGYYTFYEYAIISRSYVIGELAIILFCIGWIKWKNKILSSAETKLMDYVLPTFAILLLLNTSAYSFAIALILCLYALIWCINKKSIVLKKINYNYATIIIVFILTGALLSVLQMKPLPDNALYNNSPAHFRFNPALISSTIAHALPSYLPVPDFGVINCWNTFCFNITPGLTFMIAGTSILFLLFLSFQNNRNVLFMFFFTALVILLFNYYLILSYSRFNGQLWTVFIAALWFYYDKNESNGRPLFPFLKSLSQLTAKVLFPVLLTINMLVGFYFYFHGLTYGFSNIVAAGRYLQKPALKNLPLYGTVDFIITPLSYFTGNPVFTCERKAFSSFMIWDGKKSNKAVTFNDIISDADYLFAGLHNDSLLLCTSYELTYATQDTKHSISFTEADISPDIHLKALDKFNTPAIVNDEVFYFYLATRNKLKIDDAK